MDWSRLMLTSSRQRGAIACNCVAKKLSAYGSNRRGKQSASGEEQDVPKISLSLECHVMGR